MEPTRGACAARKPFVMTNLKTRDGLDEVVAFIEQRGLLQAAPAAAG